MALTNDELRWASVMALTTPRTDLLFATPITQPTVLDSGRYQPMQKNPASVTDYLTVDFSGTYEVCVTAMCIQTTGHTQTLFGRRSTTRRQGPFFDISWNEESYPNSYYFRHSDTENIVVPKAEFPVVTGEWMVHKMAFRNGELTAKIEYRDGKTYFMGSLQNVQPGPSACIPLVGGELSTASVNDFIADNCILDLANTYIKIGGTIVWGRRAVR